MSAAERLDPGLRHTETFDLALGDQLPHGAGDIFDRHVRIDAVLVEQIDRLDAQAPEGSLDGAADVIGPAADAPVLPGARIDVETELGGDDDPLAVGPQCLADDLLVHEGTI